jgi:hypothetical protein
MGSTCPSEFQVEEGPGREEVVPAVVMPRVVVDGDAPFPDHFEPFARHDDGRLFIDADAQQLRIKLDAGRRGRRILRRLPQAKRWSRLVRTGAKFDE